MPPLKQDLEYLGLASLKFSPHNSRAEFVGEASQEWEDFKAEIKEHGILQPLLCKKDDEGDGYYVLDGRRRLQALQELYSNREGKLQAGAPAIPCEIVDVKEAIDELTLSSLSNLHRLDLSPSDWSGVVAKLKKMGLTQDQIAKRLHKSKGWVSMIKEGKAWSEHKKTTSSQVPQAREFEEVPCPACGNILKPTFRDNKLELEVVGLEVVGQDQAEKPKKKMRKEAKGA